VWEAEAFGVRVTDKGWVINSQDDYYQCCCKTGAATDTGWVSDPGFPLIKMVWSLVAMITLATIDETINSQTRTVYILVINQAKNMNLDSTLH
jgi:hypothetical protein